jgi:hypothetical protein
MEITIHTGFIGEQNTIHVAWYDENGVDQKTDIELNVKDQDKPRELELIINGLKIVDILPVKD